MGINTAVGSSHELTEVVLTPWEDLSSCNTPSKDKAEGFIMCVEAVDAPHM